MRDGVLRVPVTVEFEDVDSYGIAHHARLVAYLERARLRFLLERGLPVHPDGCLPVMADLSMRFLRPARLMDRLEVEVRLREADDFRLTLDYRIVRAGELVARARSVIAFLDPVGGGPAPVPEAFLRVGVPVGDPGKE
ncbi:MAG TPA: thioesterase family protein [Myxococcota bacterium]|nr:thioesterase family protein [Myxococcota bacterium]HQK52578.1 thioesterase family protein [Myxococcota bacterium]